MKIKRLVIENFKSIERIELIEPNPFTVFVGPNGSGKSNIFEALEFLQLTLQTPTEIALSLFGGKEQVIRFQNPDKMLACSVEGDGFEINEDFHGISEPGYENIKDPLDHPGLKHFSNFTRLFIGKEGLVKLKYTDNKRLTLSASNLEKVLKRILLDDILKSEIFEWLELFVPGFKAAEIDERDELHWFEEFAPKYFTKDLISDGTYNILALLTAVYQSNEPQFICIEEIENGLNPEVVKELVQFFRYKCEEKGHYIWINTHSQTLVSQLRSDEIIVVDKIKGATQTKQFKGRNFHGLRMDEAWLMNVLGGGLPW